MIFVVGGVAQGKSEYAKSLGLPEKNVIDDFNSIIEEDFDAGVDTRERLDNLLQNDENLIIVGTEMGCGIVPMDRRIRDLREYNGRINCYIAAKASTVILMVGGIPLRIK